MSTASIGFRPLEPVHPVATGKSWLRWSTILSPRSPWPEGCILFIGGLTSACSWRGRAGAGSRHAVGSNRGRRGGCRAAPSQLMRRSLGGKPECLVCPCLSGLLPPPACLPPSQAPQRVLVSVPAARRPTPALHFAIGIELPDSSQEWALSRGTSIRLRLTHLVKHVQSRQYPTSEVVQDQPCP